MSIPAPIPHPAAGKPTLEELVARRVALKADAEYIAGEIAAIDAQLIDQLDVGTHDVDGVKVQVREYSRIAYPQLEKDYPAEQYPDLYATKTAIDQAAVKKQFAPAALEPYKVRGSKSVVI
ncbi:MULTISPECIES: hypothetical protein [unclassified Microbacterium]|uniref:hypothetical protein n=1 Tax=Microbacterium TaxID=33882 RepID=UPI003BA0C133